MPRASAQAREARSESRRAQIVDAALRLWMRSGFDPTTVDAIAREAAVAKGTIYLYFPTKEAILEEAVRRYSLTGIVAEVTETLAGVPPEEAVPRVVSTVWERLRERGPLVALLLREVPLRPENARMVFERLVLPANRALAQWLDAGVRSGALRGMDTFVAARALVGMLMAFLITQEILGGRDLVPIADAAITGTIADLFLRGVLPSRPGKRPR
jgi:AcrR family transcriptional regulator